MKTSNKFFFLILISLFATIVRAQDVVRVCGRYEKYELPNNSHWAAIVDYKAYRQGLTYSLSNPGAGVLTNLVNGYCYCVNGLVNSSMDDAGDALYRNIIVASILSGPYFNCR